MNERRADGSRTLVESAAHGRRERGEHAHGLCAARELGEARQQGRTKSRRSTVVVVAQCAVLARSTIYRDGAFT